ncbi:MAG: endonuclease domain-containing protein [Sphingomonadaceae bacterium]
MPSKQELLARAKWMRSNPTEAESKLWSILRNKRFAGYKFKRQVVIDWYIADFVNFEQRVIVEADGSQHLENDYDVRRDAYLKGQGFEVVRFWNNDIFLETRSVEDAIWHALHRPSPLAGEGGPEGVGRGGTEQSAASVDALPTGAKSGYCGAPAPSPSLAPLAFPSPARGEGFLRNENV